VAHFGQELWLTLVRNNHQLQTLQPNVIKTFVFCALYGDNPPPNKVNTPKHPKNIANLPCYLATNNGTII
jgi:hypothetical protein